MSAPLYGLIAEFPDASTLTAATAAARAAGYRRLDAYSPFPIEEVSDALGFRHTAMALIVLLGGGLSGAGGFFMEYWMSVHSYALNVGSRPLNSWIPFIVITFELTVLGGAIAALVGMLAANGLPRPYHPVFNLDRFAHASQDAFFLCIEARDPRFDTVVTRDFLRSLRPVALTEVPQ